MQLAAQWGEILFERAFLMFSSDLCLVLLQVQNVLCWSKFFMLDQKFIYILWRSETFCASPNILSQSKNLIEFSASSKTFVPPQKPILLYSNLLVWHKMFVTGTIYE